MKVIATNCNKDSTSFKRLYMPEPKVLENYGTKFANIIEKQRPLLEKLAKDCDIYVEPKFFSEAEVQFRKYLIKDVNDNPEEMRRLRKVYPYEPAENLVKISKINYDRSLPKDDYCNVLVAPKHCYRIKEIERRKNFKEFRGNFEGLAPDKIYETINSQLNIGFGNILKQFNELYEKEYKKKSKYIS